MEEGELVAQLSREVADENMMQAGKTQVFKALTKQRAGSVQGIAPPRARNAAICAPDTIFSIREHSTKGRKAPIRHDKTAEAG